jgi:hypothetical protein
LVSLHYQVLGERVSTQEAPDSGLAVKYPIKLEEKPFWVTWENKTFKDFKLWTWLQANKQLDLPLSEQAATCFNYFSIESNQIKAKELLDPFRKENRKDFDFQLQAEYNLVYPTARPITSIQLIVPREDPFGDLEINELI